MSAICGTLVIASGTAGFSAPVTITLRDITRSDDPKPVRSVEVLVEFDDSETPGFVLDEVPAHVLDEADSGTRVLNLEAHVDLDRDGALSPGDLVTLAAHPVTGVSTTAPVHLQLARI